MKTNPSKTSNMQENRIVRIHCRVETDVFEKCNRHTGGISKISKRALLAFRNAVNGGLFKFANRSRFYGRACREDKVELWLRIDAADKDLVEKLSFAMRISQAEVVRIALEWYLEVVMDGDLRAVRKWHHGHIQPRPTAMRFSFWSFGRLLEWQFPPTPASFPDFQLSPQPDPAHGA